MSKEAVSNEQRLLNRVSFSLWLLIVLVLLSTFFLFLQYSDYKKAVYESLSVVTQIWIPYSPYSSILFILALAGKIAVIYVIIVMIEASRDGVFKRGFRR